jgi:hypothetical protein
MAKDKTELEVLFPEKKVATNMGYIEVRPFSFGLLGKLSPILNDLGTAIRFENGSAEVDFGVLLYLLSRDGCAALHTLVMACTDAQDKEQIDGLDAESTVALISAIWEVCINDFLQKVTAKMAPPQPKTSSPERSPISSVEASPSQISAA